MTSQTILHSGIWRPALTLILASVVIMGSPGPSTMSATAVGAAYGFRRSLLYACGLIVGTTAVLLAVAVGVVTLSVVDPAWRAGTRHCFRRLYSLSGIQDCDRAAACESARPGRRAHLCRRISAGCRQSQGVPGHRCRIRRVQHRQRGRRARCDGQNRAPRCDDRDHPYVLASGGCCAVPCPAQSNRFPHRQCLACGGPDCHDRNRIAG